MGEEAEDQTKDDKSKITDDETKAGESGASTDDDGEGESNDEGDQVDVVLADDGSQPKTKRPNRGFSRRVNKLNRRNDASQLEASHATEALETERQKNRLLQLALDQKSEAGPATAPDPSKFDDGVSDPRYIQANNDFLLNRAGENAKKHIPKQEPQTPQTDYALERKQTTHYENAEKLGVSDYETVEDKAIEILGNDIVNQLIASNDRSHLILYHLGKNPSKAEDIADLVKTNPIRGVMELGALGEGLKVVRGKAKTEPAPDPDDELEGTSPSKMSQMSADEKKLDKLRDAATADNSMKNMQAIMDFKRKMRERARA